MPPVKVTMEDAELHLFFVRLEKALCSCQPTVRLCSCCSFCLEGPSSHSPPLANPGPAFIRPTLHTWLGGEVADPPRRQTSLLPHLSRERQPFINRLYLDTHWVSACLAQPVGHQHPPGAGPTTDHLSGTLHSAWHMAGTQQTADGVVK